MLKGGLGTAVVEALNSSELKDVKVKTFGYDDCFVKHGSVKEIEKKYGLDKNSIVNQTVQRL